MSSLPTRLLGRTGIRVSCIALGTVELGLDYGISGAGDHRRPDESAAAGLLHRALDLGINFIDTARAYGDAESIIGRALRQRRDQFVLASKVATPAGLSGREVRAHVAREIEASLVALATDRIDVMYSHSATVEEIGRGDVFAALDDARRSGKIRAVGASTYGPHAPAAAVAHGGFDCIQVAYNILDRTLEPEVFPAALAAGVGVIVRSVLLKGVLTHRHPHLPDALAELRDAAARAQDIAAGSGIGALPELAYRFVLAQPAVSCALVGTSHTHELDAAVAFGQRPPLPERALSQLRQVELRNLDLLNPGTWPPV